MKIRRKIKLFDNAGAETIFKAISLKLELDE